MENFRKCISCGKYKNRNEFIKITKEHKCGSIVIEPNSKTFGRSVYLCYNQKCIEDAFKKNKIYKLLRTNAQTEQPLKEDLLKRNLKGTTDGQFKS